MSVSEKISGKVRPFLGGVHVSLAYAHPNGLASSLENNPEAALIGRQQITPEVKGISEGHPGFYRGEATQSSALTGADLQPGVAQALPRIK